MTKQDIPVNLQAVAPMILDALSVPLLACDAHERIVFVNPAAEDQLNVKAGMLLTEQLPKLAEAVGNFRRGASNNPPLTILRGSSAPYLALLSMVKDPDGQTLTLCLLPPAPSMPDSDRRMLDFEALTLELQAIIDSSSDGLFVCDGEANVIRVNPASERIHKRLATEMVGRNMRELIPEGFIDRSAALEASVQKKVVSLLQNMPNGRKLISIGTPVFDQNGELIRVVVSERDITEIDKLQRELENQEAIKDQFRHQMLEMQQAEFEGREIIARSPNMIKALRQALKVAAADSSVLILGESGVGKGVVADMIHSNSRRAGRPLIKINCGAIPESLIEAELFGYEKGAFTGASPGGKPGQFELAHEGILFLDEIAELPLAAQVKLLRFLEDGRITRLGGTEERKLDVRVLAATHRDLEKMIESGSFRLDLYYRLNVIPIHVPALRERKDCLVPLIRHYVDHFSAINKVSKRLTRAALEALAGYAFPGNVRELMNISERLVVMSETEVIDLADLPSQIVGSVQTGIPEDLSWPETVTLQQALETVERNLLTRARERYRNQSMIAAALGVNQSTIARKLKRYGLL
ncbi:MAG: sigma 54-interacting transcriptional regulator [Desulfuromonadales bacterium]|nr:sigma 54-interacting transcriptional regulator [Desulfuromonadales bacterium]